ncbi:hypothetical protein ABEB36_006268 [Hypothenemus hampei]|uniref:Uncharacterized protein n=1 Tax=Hypothenemus hampei TaxID=57062 RepID=A0ABD1EPZ2_HYPHA
MLRTRRRDNNVKPNRRLDRKSSRGMLYENEELRLKTININAEIERGQSDIKKLKRENEMLKKEIWCLRDEYDKLDKLLKDKKIDFSSSSTTYSSSSDSESCSSCTEEPEDTETSQNLKNVQKTNLKNIHDQFDHLSIVTEETSFDNSDKNSTNTRHSLQNEPSDNNILWDCNVIKPDQSYPIYTVQTNNRSCTLPNQTQINCFVPIQHSKSFDDSCFNQIQPEDLYAPPLVTGMARNNEGGASSPMPPVTISPSPPLLYENQQVVFHDENAAENFLSKKIVHTNASNFYQNIVLAPKSRNPTLEARTIEKKATDVIVKIDNQNFNKNLTYSNTTPSTTFSNGGNLEELLHDIESISQRGCPTSQPLSTIEEPNSLHQHRIPNPENNNAQSDERLHKSELNVVLMPKAMPLIGFEKYKNIQRSFESVNSMSTSQQNLCLLPPNLSKEDVSKPRESPRLNLPVDTEQSAIFQGDLANRTETNPSFSDKDRNPFFFGNLTDNYVNGEYFNRRYNPDNFMKKEEDTLNLPENNEQGKVNDEKSVENEENIQLKTSAEHNLNEASDKKQAEQVKLPKMSLTRKVSIHFKGRKEKQRLKKLALVANNSENTPKTPSSGSKSVPKSSFFDFKTTSESPKDKACSTPKCKEKAIKQLHQKAPSIESKKSTTETSNFEPKTPNSSESDKKNPAGKKDEKKVRKSTSVSPDRAKHVHVIHDGIKKHKKHRRERSGASKAHRSSADPRHRERSYSICTDRSIIGPSTVMGLGMGYGSFLYDDYSDRERTNSGSSCESSHYNHRKMSGISNVPVNGKLPWCGCWGNGCL